MSGVMVAERWEMEMALERGTSVPCSSSTLLCVIAWGNSQ
jgi:hypothetical protein